MCVVLCRRLPRESPVSIARWFVFQNLQFDLQVLSSCLHSSHSVLPPGCWGVGGWDLLQGDRKGGGWESPEIEVGVDACGGGYFSLVGIDKRTTKTILVLINYKNFRLRRSYLLKILVIPYIHNRTSNSRDIKTSWNLR